ncbi:MAG: pyruvate dehydrogenase (acetyl-transferring) E1 component subunit alpha [Rubricoccaceae bacterium]|nr:pyruvate dehydrogenase (acetyl-transferring) E1 component subunit alpha [Rubricoccaceae bacterium]
MAGRTKSATKKTAAKKPAAKKTAAKGQRSKAAAGSNGDARTFTPEPGEFRRYWESGHTHESLGIAPDRLLAMYRNMLLQRRFEERAAQMYGRQKIAGFLHLYIGQEAVSVGAVEAVRDDDPIITAYRDHGLALARGMSTNAGMAELFGKIDGCSRGKGGSMHFFDVEKHFYGGHGIVGGQIPVGVGMAFALKYQETGGCALTFFGDGAINQGAFHEAANLAALYELPVLLIVENNEYAMGTSVERASAEPDLYKQAYAYGMTGALVDGMSLFEVYHAIGELAEEARAGKPALVEIRTYRYRGHSMSDPQKYRTKEELEAKKDEDPILRVKSYILDHDLADLEALDAMDEEVKDEVRAAVEFAEQSEFPPVETMYEDVYVQDDYPFLV